MFMNVQYLFKNIQAILFARHLQRVDWRGLYVLLLNDTDLYLNKLKAIVVSREQDVVVYKIMHDYSKRFSNLEFISLRSVRICFDLIEALRCLTSVRSLHFNTCTFNTIRALKQKHIGDRLKHVKELRFRRCNGDQLEMVKWFHKDLRHLQCSSVVIWIQDEGIFKCRLPQLESIEIES